MNDMERILQAIESQRHFFFYNNDEITFDRDTALIWTNIKNKTFPYSKGDVCYSYAEVKNLIQETNARNWGGFNDWRVPTNNELNDLTDDSTFYTRLVHNWCVDYEFELTAKDFDSNGDIRHNASGVNAILCSSSLEPKNFSYTAQEILKIFISNNLIPIFDDESINKIYKRYLLDRDILVRYDTKSINNSPIKYSAAVLRVTDELIEILSEYEAAQSETIAEFLKIALKLKAKFTDNPNLTPEENSLLAERQKFLAERLELGTDAVKAQILSVKAQAENLSARIDKINRGDNSIRELAELQAEPRADFELLVENLAQIIKAAQQRVDFFAQNKDLVASVVNSQAAWTDSYKAFKTSLREELSAECREDSVDEENFSAWYDDWQKKRFAIEERFLPLIEFALKGNLLDSIGRVLDILQSYRDAVDKFYLHERKNIYQKFAFQAGGDLQEKFETESELYKLVEKFQRDLQEIIFSSGTEERIFLLRWAEPLLNISIDEISNFIRDKELDAISEEVLTQFAELRRQNFTAYIADSKSYGEAVQKRENEFNKLIFRMRKDLNKK